VLPGNTNESVTKDSEYGNVRNSDASGTEEERESGIVILPIVVSLAEQG
jgi:hypothetical protein